MSWYRGDGDFIDAIGGNNGIPVGGVGFAPGRIDQSFIFDSSFVYVPNSPALEPTTVSVEAWVNLSNGNQHNNYLLAKGADGDIAASYALYTGPNGGLSFYVYDGNSSYIASPDAGVDIWDDTWHHVVGTYDGESVRLFIDGTEIGSGTATNIAIGYGLSDSNELYLGAYPGQSQQHYFSGKIDEASIYDRALSVAQIQSLFTSGKSVETAEGVSVNLQLGEATGLFGGIANIQNVIGSSGNDVLVGNGGNVLSGGMGRDLLIAGAFSSILNGGGDEDILIAGTTDYDRDQVALNSIIAEWSRTADYTARTANLSNGSNQVPLLDASTVHSNGGLNVLSGNEGLDFFFGNFDGLDTVFRDLLTETSIAI